MDNKIKEIENKLKELSSQLEELKKEEQEEDYIESPFHSDPVFVHIDLQVNNKQTLKYNLLTNTYNVRSNTQSRYKLKVRKTPTPQNKLEVGKFYVVYDCDGDLHSMINDISRYKLYLGNGEYVFYNNGFTENDSYWKYWHEVVCLVE